MRNFFSCLLILLLTFGMAVNEVSAKRFGGGRSFGVQRSQSSFFSHPQNATKSAIGSTAKRNQWGGMLGGLLAGGLLASLFMGHGLGSGLFSWLIIGAVALFAISFLRRRMQTGSYAPKGSNAWQPEVNSASNAYSSGRTYQQEESTTAYPAGFSETNFLRDAKVTFIRLQAAFDQKNLQDLNTFTAPEVFAEIQMQLQERGDLVNKTEVVNLAADLLEVVQEDNSTIASVRFTGTIKENDDARVPLEEIWNFRQFKSTDKWVVAGIQQLN